MTSTIDYINEWQEALQIEVNHLMKYGSSKYKVMNGRLISNDGAFTYYFDIATSIRVPTGSTIKVEWGSAKEQGRILSVEGKGVIISVEKSLGDLIDEATLYHDPWELLDNLIQRFDEIKKKKKPRGRIKRLMNPPVIAKHPTDNLKGNIHELVLRSKYNPATFVWGPPGTGKTYTLARVAANKYFKGKRVLILSQSNQAVDVLMAEITAFIKKKKKFVEGEILRAGTNISAALSAHEDITTAYLLQVKEPQLASTIDQLTEERNLLKLDIAGSFSKRDSHSLLDIEKKITNMLERIRHKEAEFLKKARVIGTTMARAAGDESIFENEFDLVMIDEASMSYIPQVAFAAALGKRVVVCGDFKQLPPIASSRHPLVNQWLKEDIYHRSGVVEGIHDSVLHPQLFLLKEQRRMHPSISAFTNKYIYQGLVGDHESVVRSRNDIVVKSPFPNQASILLDTSHSGEYCISERTSHSKFNIWQLFLSFQLIHEAYLDGAVSIGYVTPYRAQAVLMEKMLSDLYENECRVADIVSATVHRFQGSERDVMIFDTVDSYPQQRVGMLLAGKESERLINVAVTRTKGKFLHVSNRSFVQDHLFKNKTLRQLVDYQESKRQLVTQGQIGQWIKNQHPRLQWRHARKIEQTCHDIKNAHESIIISLPNHSDVPEELVNALKNRRASANLTLLSDNPYLKIKPDKWISTNTLPFSLIIIDRCIMWVGIPIISSIHTQPPYVSVRLDSNQVTDHFLSQIPIDK